TLTPTGQTSEEILMRTPLSNDQLNSALGELNGWSREGQSITKTFTFPKFADGIAFVQRIAVVADAMDHHPDIDIRYTKIRIGLSTHDAGGVTKSDVELAGKIEKLRV